MGDTVESLSQNKVLRAVLKGSLREARDCIFYNGEDPTFKDDHNRSYLHLSVYMKNPILVEFFIHECGVDVNGIDSDGVSALHRACRYGREDIVKILIKNGASPKAVWNKHEVAPSHVAAAFGHVECIKALYSIKTDLDIDIKDYSSHTPLHYAASEGQLKAAAALIEYGCDVNMKNDAGNQPLHFAAASESPEVEDLCLLLIRRGAQVDARNHKGLTALHYATQQGCLGPVSILLNQGADPNIIDEKGNTYSHSAIKSGYTDMVKVFMLDARTDSSIRDDEGNTVLHVALKLGHFNLIPMMLPRARDLTRTNAQGCSVIIEAIRNQLEDLALEMLKTCPSLVHTATDDLVTPLHLAAERGMTNLTKQLLIAGAQVDALDSSGLTPSLYCAKNDAVLECLAMIENEMMIPDTFWGIR